MKHILVVTAHPDDETFALGGTIVKYHDAGYSIELLCATQGEKGKSAIHENISNDELANVRVLELEQAAKILGISSTVFMGYKDKGLSKLHAGDLEDAIYKHMCANVPDIVITFDTTGISNHPDHIKVCYATTFAFQKYAKLIKNRIDEIVQVKLVNDTQGEYIIPEEPKLYYACMPKSIAEYLQQKEVLETEMNGKLWEGTQDKYITTVIDISEYSGKKLQAIQAYKTQVDDKRRYSDIPNHPLLKQEYFILRMHGLLEVFVGKKDEVSSEL